jgi:hypothetical protein
VPRDGADRLGRPVAEGGHHLFGEEADGFEVGGVEDLDDGVLGARGLERSQGPDVLFWGVHREGVREPPTLLGPLPFVAG